MTRSKFLPVVALSLLAGGAIILAGTVSAAPKSYEIPSDAVELKAGPEPGYQAAQYNCMSCHSVDYIRTQPPGKGKAFWDATVRKMMKVYGAPIEEADAAAIADYLGKTY